MKEFTKELIYDLMVAGVVIFGVVGFCVLVGSWLI